jgi:hypothetical protein
VHRYIRLGLVGKDIDLMTALYQAGDLIEEGSFPENRE